MKKLFISRYTHLTLFVAVAAVLIASFSHLTYAATGSLTFSPSSGSATVGSNLVITLHENSGTDSAIGVDAIINFPASQLKFLSSTTVAPFSVPPPDNVGNGTVEVVRGAYSGVTGDQVVTTLTFSVLAPGTATLSFGSSTISPASGSGNLLTSSPSSSYTLSAAAAAPPSTPPSTPVNTPPPTQAGPTPPSGSTKSTSVSVAPKGGAAVDVPNGGTASVTNSVAVQPSTIQTEGVNKVEYYLGSKLVDTETTAPYTFNVDTSKLKNGSYDLIVKTYYSNGSTKQSTQHLDIKNAASKSSINPLGPAALILILIVAAILLIFKKRRLKPITSTVDVSSDIVTSDSKVPPFTSSQATVAPTPMFTPPAGTTPNQPTINTNLPGPGTVIGSQDNKLGPQ